MAPVSWNGSNTLYHKVIKPFVLRHQKNIDKALDEVGEKMDSYAQQGKLLKKAECFLPLANKRKQTVDKVAQLCIPCSLIHHCKLITFIGAI